MNRILNVTRVQLVNAPTVLGIPVLVLVLAFLANLGIFWAIGDDVPPEGRITGAISSIFVVMLVVHLQTMTQVFPFALGLSVTRRTFFAATSLFVVAQSLAYGVVLYLLLLLEQATGGWGIGLKFAGVPFLVQDNPLIQILVYTVPMVFIAFVGVYLGVVFKRWGQSGLYVLGIGGGVLLALLVMLVTWQGWWPAVGRFFTEQPILALLIGYPLVLAGLLASAGYLTLRRATP